jgi:hypothetical protein
MLDALSVRLLLATLVGWLDQRQQEAMAYLIEENRILRAHVRGVLAPLAVDQATARCSCGHESLGNSAAHVSTTATTTRSVRRNAVKT